MSADADDIGRVLFGLVDREHRIVQNRLLIVVHLRLREASVADVHRRTELGGQQLRRHLRPGHFTGSLGDGTTRVNHEQAHELNLPTSRRPGRTLRDVLLHLTWSMSTTSSPYQAYHHL